MPSCAARITIGLSKQNLATCGALQSDAKRMRNKVVREVQRAFPDGSTSVRALGTYRCSPESAGGVARFIREPSIAVDVLNPGDGCPAFFKKAEALGARIARKLGQQSVLLTYNGKSGSCVAFVGPNGKRDVAHPQCAKLLSRPFGGLKKR